MFLRVKDEKPGRELGEAGHVISDVLEGDGWSFPQTAGHQDLDLRCCLGNNQGVLCLWVAAAGFGRAPGYWEKL